MKNYIVNSEKRDAMIELRRNDYTYQEIANIFGISRQRVHQIINKKEISNTPHRAEILSKIVYEGIYQMFANDGRMTFRKLARIASNEGSNTIDIAKALQRLSYGENTKISIKYINNILKYTNLTYEEMFKIRER